MDGSIGGIQKGTLVNLTGMISVTTGQIFTVTHDDGLTLTINGLSVVSAPGPTAPVPTTGIYTGASGTFNFQLVYTECCGGPAVLELQAVPGPIVGAGLPGLLFAGGGLLGWWRRKRKAEAAA
jgi:hypothetical protein